MTDCIQAWTLVIQAAASVAVAILTGALVMVTMRLVRATNALKAVTERMVQSGLEPNIWMFVLHEEIHSPDEATMIIANPGTLDVSGMHLEITPQCMYKSTYGTFETATGNGTIEKFE